MQKEAVLYCMTSFSVFAVLFGDYASVSNRQSRKDQSFIFYGTGNAIRSYTISPLAAAICSQSFSMCLGTHLEDFYQSMS